MGSTLAAYGSVPNDGHGGAVLQVRTGGACLAGQGALELGNHLPVLTWVGMCAILGGMALAFTARRSTVSH